MGLSSTEIVFFVMAVIIVGTIVAILNGLSPTGRTLIDNDGYMRFLKIEQLAVTGDWFDSVFHRSNYPYGETLHWTRPLDVYVFGLSLLLRPFVGEEALYWASFINGPLLLIAAGLLGVWAFGWFMRPGIRGVFLLAHLGLPLLIAYFGFGRVDHHGLILLVFIWTIGILGRTLHDPTPRRAALLGVSLGLGLWVSVEFLVPWLLVAATLGVLVVHTNRAALSQAAVVTFISAAASTAVALMIERGASASEVEFARIAIVHVIVAVVLSLVFLGLSWLGRRNESSLFRWLGLLGLSSVGCVVLLLVFPQLVAGPFVDFDPIVRDRWLSRVTELLPVSLDEGSGLIVFRMAPIVFGLVALPFAYRQTFGRPGRTMVGALGGWMIVYAVLTVMQFRWAMFSHYLALILIVVAFGGLYDRMGEMRGAVLVRPLLIASVLLFPLVGGGIESDPAGTARDCSLEDVLPTLRRADRTTILADQDIGPNLLYHTDHNVVVTPYGNSSAFLFMFDTLAETDFEVARTLLAERSVGLILVCPGPQDLTYPLEPEGTLYAALIDGTPPDFVHPMPVAASTDYLLFEVEVG